MTDPHTEEQAPHCRAMTRSGQPCRNRPLDGQPYCRMHAALAEPPGPTLQHEAVAEPFDPAAQPETAIPIVTPEEEIPIESAEEEIPIENAAPEDERAAADAAVQELEVEIRNQAGGQPEARDMAASAIRLIRENLRRMGPEAFKRAAALIRDNISSDYLDPDFWRGISMVLRYQVDETVALIQRRMRGEYSTDEFGMDMELIDLVRPFSAFLYRTYWRVTASGLEQVPSDGPALLLANHGGVLPWDSVMIATAILEEHASPRVVRSLYPPMLRAIPGVTGSLAAFGQAPDTPETALRLLEDGQLVNLFPEGVSALGKLFKNRYKLQRFRRSGSVGLAIKAGAPIVPVAVVGSEEAYPMLADASPLAQMLRLPFFPLTPLFPWLGPIGLLPLPSKWSITFGEPIATAGRAPADADDPQVLAQLSGQVRERLQAMLDEQLANRKSVFA
jgi:1-acyl-sn-glycerol-3-phosphate acyltransferase